VGGATIVTKVTPKWYEVPVITLGKILEEYVERDDAVFLKKYGYRGGEFHVFNNIDIDTLKRIEAIVGEIHLRYGDIKDIEKKLKLAGFWVYSSHPPLIAKPREPCIKVKGLTMLKLLGTALYTAHQYSDLKKEAVS